jgi:hypothetical protein
MTTSVQQPLPRLNAPEDVMPWADRLITEMWRRLFDATTEANVGQDNTGSNLGGGIGVYDSKLALDLRFRAIAAASTRIAVALNGSDIEIDAVINDAGSSNGDIWSASKIAAEIAAGTGHSHIYHEEISGTGTGPFALANTPIAGTVEVYFNLIRLRQVGAAPGINEYTISGANITLGFSKAGGDYMTADYDAVLASPHTHTVHEELVG